MNVMNNMQPSSVQLSSSSQTKATTQNNTSFLSCFDSAIGKENVGNDVTPILEEEIDVHAILLDIFQQIVDSESHQTNELLDQIEIPTDIKEEVIELLADEVSIATIVSQGQGYMQNPAQLLAIIAKLSKMTQAFTNVKDQNFGKVMEKLVEQLDKILPNILTPNDKTQLNRNEFLLSLFGKSQSVTEPLPTAIPIVQNGPINNLHQFVLHVGDGRSDQGNSERLLQQFQNMLSKSSLIQYPNGINKLSIKLFPQHLGRLDVTLTQQNGIIIAQFLTTTKAAKNALESQMFQLKQAFISQNIQVEKIEVQTQQQQQSYTDKQNQEEKNQQQQQNSKQPSNDDKDESLFEELLKENFEVKV